MRQIVYDGAMVRLTWDGHERVARTIHVMRVGVLHVFVVFIHYFLMLEFCKLDARSRMPMLAFWLFVLGIIGISSDCLLS